MAIVDIIELVKPETGEKFYPYAHISGVKGAELLPRIGGSVQTTLPTPIFQIKDALNAQFYPQIHAEAVIGLAQMIESNQFFVKEPDGNGGFRIKLKDEFSGFYANGWAAAGGVGSGGGGGGGLITSVRGVSDLGTPILNESLTETFSAKAIESIWEAVLALQQSTPNVSLTNGGSYSTLTINGSVADFYTKAQVDGLISGIHSFEPVPVQTLPTASADTMYKLYLVPSSDPQSQNIKDEYITYRTGSAGNYTYSWEQVGSTAIDLTGYATELWVNQQGFLKTETDPTVPAWAKASTKPSYAFSELTSHPTTISGYGITDAKFGTPGTDNVPITLGSTTKSVLTDHQDLTPLTNRLSAIEDWFEVVNVGTAESPNYALHAKQGRAIYSDSWIAAGGVGSGSSSSGGLITRVRSITDLGTAIATESLTETFSAKAIEGIYEEVRNLTGSGLATQTWVNGQGFLKTETDPTVPAWAKAESKPSYSLSEIDGTRNLRAIEALTGNGLLRRTGTYTWEMDTATYMTSGTTLDSIADGNTRKLANYLPLAGGTMTGTITMSGANIFPSASHTCNIGASSAFFAGLYGDTIHAHAFELYSSGSVQAFRMQGGIENAGTDNEVYYALLTLHQGTGEGLYITKDTMFGMGTAKDLGKTYARWKGIYGASADLTGNLDLGGVLRVNSLNTIDQSNETMSLFNFGARATKTFNAYGTGANFRACDSSGNQVNILAINATKIQAGSDFIPNYTEGLNLGGSSANTRWATIYGVNADLTGDLALAQTSHIDIGPLRIEYDATNKALHITKADSSDTTEYGIYADGFVAAGGVGQTS